MMQQVKVERKLSVQFFFFFFFFFVLKEQKEKKYSMRFNSFSRRVDFIERHKK